jgi:hypothetical protein
MFQTTVSVLGEEIKIRLRKVYNSAAYCHLSMFRWVSAVDPGNKELRNEGGPGRPYRRETDTPILSILQEDRNASLRTIAETLSISPETVRTHMSLLGDTRKT